MINYTSISRLAYGIALSLIIIILTLIFYRIRLGALRSGIFFRICLVGLLLGGLLTYWTIFWQMSIIPANVNLTILEPDMDQVSFREPIYVSAVPDPERVYLLIHPYSTQFWYVQNTPSITNTLDQASGTDQIYWRFDVQFGTQYDTDCGLKFDMIALASRDPYLIDIFRGRIFYESEMIDMFRGRTVKILAPDKSSTLPQTPDPKYQNVGALPVLNSSNQIVVTKKCD